MTEGTTRLLETPERPPIASGPEIHEYGSLAQATNRLPPQANQTSRSLDAHRKPTNLVLISVIIFAALAMMAMGLFIGLRSGSTTTPTQPTVTTPGLPPVQPPPPPPPPSLPPPRTGVPQGGTISQTLVYPGAETTMEITDPTEGNVLQLHTTDSFDKVVQWYTGKLKPTKVIKQPSNVILVGAETTAILTETGDGTNIMLTQSRD